MDDISAYGYDLLVMKTNRIRDVRGGYDTDSVRNGIHRIYYGT